MEKYFWFRANVEELGSTTISWFGLRLVVTSRSPCGSSVPPLIDILHERFLNEVIVRGMKAPAQVTRYRSASLGLVVMRGNALDVTFTFTQLLLLFVKRRCDSLG